MFVHNMKSLLSIFLPLVFVSASIQAQQLTFSNYRHRTFVNMVPNNIDNGVYLNGNLYFHAVVPLKIATFGAMKYTDSTFMYNVKNEMLVEQVQGKSMLFKQNDALYAFWCDYNEIDEEHTVWTEHLTVMDDGYFHKASDNVIYKKVIEHSKNAGSSAEYRLSPDSNYISFVSHKNVEKDESDIREFNVHNVKKDDDYQFSVNFSADCSGLSLVQHSVDNNGNVFAILCSGVVNDEFNVAVLKCPKNVVNENQRIIYKTTVKLSGQKFQAKKFKLLKDNRLLIAIMSVNNSKDLENPTLQYDIISTDNGKSLVDGMKRISINDWWKDSQPKALMKYNLINIDDILITENGKIYITGYPSMVTYSGRAIINNRYTYAYATYQFGGNYIICLNEKGEYENTSYFDHYCAGYTATYDNEMRDLGLKYNVFAYGNNIYFLYNESKKRVDSNKPKAFYKPGSKDFYVMLTRFGDDGQKTFNLTSSILPSQAVCSLLCRDDSKFYFTTKSDKYGSFCTLKME